MIFLQINKGAYHDLLLFHGKTPEVPNCPTYGLWKLPLGAIGEPWELGLSSQLGQ